jgi:excisionase family DNA binding protein
MGRAPGMAAIRHAHADTHPISAVPCGREAPEVHSGAFCVGLPGDRSGYGRGSGHLTSACPREINQWLAVIVPGTTPLETPEVNRWDPMTSTLDRLRLLNHFVRRPADLWPGPPDGTMPASAAPAGSARELSDSPAADGPVIAGRFLSVPEVAAILGVSEKTVRRRLRTGLLRKAALGGRIVRVPAAELVRLAGTAIPQAETNTISEVAECYDGIPQ